MPEVSESVEPELGFAVLMCIALGGAIGDPLNGRLFDVFGSYRALFLLMTCYTAFAFVAVFLVPKGAGEAETTSLLPVA